MGHLILNFSDEGKNLLYQELKSILISDYGFTQQFEWIFDLILDINHKYFGKKSVRIDYNANTPTYRQPYSNFFELVHLFIQNTNHIINEVELIGFTEVHEKMFKIKEKYIKDYQDKNDYWANWRQSRNEHKEEFDFLFGDRRIDVVKIWGKDYEAAFEDYYTSIRNTDLFESEVWLSFQNKLIKLLETENILHVPIDKLHKSNHLRSALYSGDIEGIIQNFRSHFRSIPYDHLPKLKEGFFNSHIYTALEYAGIENQDQKHTTIGRSDIIIEAGEYIYCLEFKLDETEEVALKQIIEKEYLEPYMYRNKKLIAIGIQFSSKTYNIESYKEKILK